MASITIRNFDDDVKTRLRDAGGRKVDSRDLAGIARAYFGPDNGVDLELPPREPGREPPSFD